MCFISSLGAENVVPVPELADLPCSEELAEEYVFHLKEPVVANICQTMQRTSPAVNIVFFRHA